MTRTLIATAAALLATTAAHAKGPELPGQFRGPWCSNSQTEMRFVPGHNCQAVDMVDITPSEVDFHAEPSCTPAYVRPVANGRYHVTLACPDATEGEPMQIVHYWMRVYQGWLYMQRVDSTFTKPAKESKSASSASGRIPQQFHGEYCEVEQGEYWSTGMRECLAPEQITVHATGIEFYENSCTFRRQLWSGGGKSRILMNEFRCHHGNANVPATTLFFTQFRMYRSSLYFDTISAD